MNVFPNATTAPKEKTETAKQVAVLYAVVLTAMAVAQLFTFEAFIDLVASYNLPLEGVVVFLVAPLLVVVQVFALPFLLRMALSPAFRWVSMVCGWLAALLWFSISLWIVVTSQPIDTVGLLGTAVPLAPGWWAVLISAAFGILAAWASWGMWPGRVASKHSKK